MIYIAVAFILGIIFWMGIRVTINDRKRTRDLEKKIAEQREQILSKGVVVEEDDSIEPK